jgi:predicted component of type VI protein secretion system
MPKLVLLKNMQPQEEHPLEEQETVIGRGTDCAIRLQDESVSRRHLRVLTIMGETFIEDLGSTNGTFINGERVTKTQLNDGDIVQLGRVHLRYHADRPASSLMDTQQDFSETQIIDPAALGALAPQAKSQPFDGTRTGIMPAAPQQQPAADTPPPAPEAPIQAAELRVLNGSKSGQTLALNKAVTGIGRGGKRLAAVTRRTGGYVLVPLPESGMENVQIRLNGQAPDPHGTPLRDRDVIDLGGLLIQFLHK